MAILKILRSLATVFGACAVFSSCAADSVKGENRTDSSHSDRIQAYIDSIYAPNDVRHSYRTSFGETVDCVDFFAWPTVRQLAKQGTPLLSLPKPPPEPRSTSGAESPSRLSRTHFHSERDEDGRIRECPNGTVPTVRLLRSTIEEAGGLDQYFAKIANPKRKAAPPSQQRGAASRGPIAVRALAPKANPAQSPLPPLSGACTEFATTDLPSYAHVQQTVYPPDDTWYTGGNLWLSASSATLGIYKPAVPDNSGPSGYYNDHSIAQIWMYSGWGFDAFGCGCTTSVSMQSQTNPPCAQSIEVGWDIAPDDPDVYTGGNRFDPHLFIFATSNGYDYNPYSPYVWPGCYNSVAPGWPFVCPVTWVPSGLGGALPLGKQLPVPSGTTNYELELAVQASTSEGGVSGSGWWVEAGVNELTPDSMNPAQIDVNTWESYPLTWLGYYAYSVSGTGYSGPMASGHAQTFQVGGEVADNEETNPAGCSGSYCGNWTVPMGSGVDPSSGWNSAAYVRDIAICSGSSCGLAASAMGPVLTPSVYTYSVSPSTPDFNEPAWYNYFFYGDGVDRFTWSGFTTPTSQPALYAPTLALGGNELTIAPVYVWNSSAKESVLNIYALGTAVSSGNRRVWKYDGSIGTWSGVEDAGGGDLFLDGVTTDESNGAFWGWSAAHHLWTNDPGLGGISNSFTFYTSVAAASSSDAIATVYNTPCNSTSPKGNCLSAPGGTPGTTGAEQVTVDPMEGNLYALDSSGQAWGWVGYPLDAWFPITMSKCPGEGGSIAQIDMIAAKAGLVFAIGETGTVYYYPGVCGTAWSIVGNGSKNSFAVSIATDNGFTKGVWATDASGNIWTAE